MPHSAVVIPCESARPLPTREKGGDESDPPKKRGGHAVPKRGALWHPSFRPHDWSLSSSFIPAGRLGTALHKLVFSGGGRGAGLFTILETFATARHPNRARAMMTIRTKVSGVSFENRDGSERQRIIAKCKAGDRLYLRHDPDNEYSDFAIEVHHGPPGHETQIGFLEDGLASNLLNHLSVNILDVTGGTPDKPTRGVNMEILLSGSGYLEEEEPERGLHGASVPGAP